MNRIPAQIACLLTCAANSSFEREFDKHIGIQDTLAKIIEDKSNRAIRSGAVNLAGMMFLPI